MTSMIDVYYGLVKAGRRDIESVPEKDGIKTAVIALIEADGTGQ